MNEFVCSDLLWECTADELDLVAVALFLIDRELGIDCHFESADLDLKIVELLRRPVPTYWSAEEARPDRAPVAYDIVDVLADFMSGEPSEDTLAELTVEIGECLLAHLPYRQFSVH